MPIDLCSSVNNISNYAFGSSILNSIFGSPVVLAIIISIIMVLLIMFLYPAKPGTSITIIIKMFIYMALSSFLIIFLHDGIIKYALEEEHQEKNNESFMRGTTIGGRDPVYGNYQNINPYMHTDTINTNTLINQELQETQKQLETPPKVPPISSKSSSNSPVEGQINGGYQGSIIGGEVNQTLVAAHPPSNRKNPYGH